MNALGVQDMDGVDLYEGDVVVFSSQSDLKRATLRKYNPKTNQITVETIGRKWHTDEEFIQRFGTPYRPEKFYKIRSAS